MSRISSSTTLEKTLGRFQLSSGLPPVTSTDEARRDMQEAIECLARERARHPGLYLLSDLRLHIICLEQFFDGAKTCLTTAESLAQAASLVNACYDIASDGVMNNALLDVEGEIPTPNLPVLRDTGHTPRNGSRMCQRRLKIFLSRGSKKI